MAAHASRRLRPMVDNALNIIAIEWLCAAQGCDFHAPLTSSPMLEAVRTCLRARIPRLTDDRYIYPDLQAAHGMVRNGQLIQGLDLPSLV